MFTLDNNKPVYLQLIDEYKQKIVLGVYALNQKLPSTRETALEYSVNPNTAARVYKEMEALGLCYYKKGLGTYVVDDDTLVNRLKKEMADGYLATFLKNMKSIGYSKESILESIKER